MLFLKLKRKGSNFEMVRKWEGEMGKWEGVREREIGKGDRVTGRWGDESFNLYSQSVHWQFGMQVQLRIHDPVQKQRASLFVRNRKHLLLI